MVSGKVRSVDVCVHVDVSVCTINFFIVSIVTELYWRVSRLRAMMSLSRLNLHFPEED